MPDHSADNPKPNTVRDTRIEPAGEFVVEHRPAPSKGAADKSIHRRRPLPPVPEKDLKPDAEESPD